MAKKTKLVRVTGASGEEADYLATIEVGRCRDCQRRRQLVERGRCATCADAREED